MIWETLIQISIIFNKVRLKFPQKQDEDGNSQSTTHT